MTSSKGHHQHSDCVNTFEANVFHTLVQSGVLTSAFKFDGHHDPSAVPYERNARVPWTAYHASKQCSIDVSTIRSTSQQTDYYSPSVENWPRGYIELDMVVHASETGNWDSFESSSYLLSMFPKDLPVLIADCVLADLTEHTRWYLLLGPQDVACLAWPVCKKGAAGRL